MDDLFIELLIYMNIFIWKEYDFFLKYVYNFLDIFVENI